MKLIHIIAGLALATAPLAAQAPVYLDETKPIEDRVEDALSRMTLEEKIAVIHAQSKFSSRGVPRLGIPEIWTTDGPHGIRAEVLWDEWDQAGWTNDSCVAFPALTCLAATWNEDMSLLYGKSIGEEARYRNKAMLLGPGVNIYRTPLNGRNFEYMGEDPYLAATMVVPYVKGVQSNGVAACVKHFALNNHEVNRYNTNVIVDDRTLYEIYLPAFKAAVQEGGAWAIMGSYNLYKNQACCHNQYLLNDILRGEWGYDGVVVSDWGGTHDTDEAIHNGLDMEFGSWTNGLSEGASNAYDSYYLALPYLKKIRSGEVGTEEQRAQARLPHRDGQEPPSRQPLLRRPLCRRKADCWRRNRAAQERRGPASHGGEEGLHHTGGRRERRQDDDRGRRKLLAQGSEGDISPRGHTRALRRHCRGGL